MDEYTADAFANRDDTAPVIPVGSKGKSKHKNVKTSLQDRIFTRILEQVIPKEDVDNKGDLVSEHAVPHAKKPSFSLPLMANNFRRFNARIGIVFKFQNRVERLLSWRKPTQTISFLFVYSFVCLDPYLLCILPMTAILLGVMVPGFIARHPPPPSTSTSSTTPYYSYHGPALAPAKTIKPASETSKDFFRNMRDLQNCMADFADLHDATISAFAPLTDFSNENLASITFLLCTVVAVLLFFTAHLLPWRFICLLGGNAAIISAHPTVQMFIKGLKVSAATEAPSQVAAAVASTPSIPPTPSAAMSVLESVAQISLDSYTEEREVEIFELQHRSLAPYSQSQWEHFLFSPLPYDPLSPSRIAGDRPRGCRFFEDVRPPPGWAWKSKKWELDLDCREWVVERMITGVGFEVPGNPAEGGSNGATTDEVGGWVWDLAPNPPSRDEDEVITTLAYGDLKESRKAGHSHSDSSISSMLKEKIESKPAVRDWEEGPVEPHGMGEWKRRRWVRIVHRISVPVNTEKDKSGDEED